MATRLSPRRPGGRRTPTPPEWRQPQPALLVALALLTVYLVWGSTYLGIRVAVQTLPPFMMASVRFLTAGALLWTWSIRRGDVEGDRIGPRQWGAAAIVGCLLLTTGNAMVGWGEQTVPSGIAALLVASMPLWMAVMSRGVLGERLGRRAAVGLLLGFAGVAMLVQPSGGERLDPLGTAAILFAAVSWALGSVWSRRLPLPSRPLVATSMEMLAGGGLLALLSLATGEFGRFDPHQVSGASLLAVLYLIVFGSLLAFSAYVWLLGATSTSVLSTYAYVNPVIAVALGWALLGETINTGTLAGGVVIVTAVALIVTRRPAAAAADEVPAPPR
ncbi:MAG: EamA family transporter [Nitriliruptorales bacterium]|nr:EamA family transporter [Nitriliruptorales bacterium]